MKSPATGVSSGHQTAAISGAIGSPVDSPNARIFQYLLVLLLV